MHKPADHGEDGCRYIVGKGTASARRCGCQAKWVVKMQVPEEAKVILAERDERTQEVMRWLVPNPSLPAGAPAAVAREFWESACRLLTLVDDGRQLRLCLQRMVDARDAAVRQAVADGGTRG
jgi:hypothetical protein